MNSIFGFTLDPVTLTHMRGLSGESFLATPSTAFTHLILAEPGS
jgi:hypothetical protein